MGINFKDAPVNQSPIDKATPKTVEEYDKMLSDLEEKYNKDRENYLKQERAAGADWNPLTKNNKEVSSKIKAKRKELERLYKNQRDALEVERDKVKKSYRDVTPKNKIEEKEEAFYKEQNLPNPSKPLIGGEKVNENATISSGVQEKIEEEKKKKEEEKLSDNTKKDNGTPSTSTTSSSRAGSLEELFKEQADKATNKTDADMKKDAELLQKYQKLAENNIDPSYIENLPKDVFQAFAQGQFGRSSIDKTVKDNYEKIKKIPEDKLTDAQKLDLEEYKKQKKEKSRSIGQLSYFIVNSLLTGLGNVGSFMKNGSNPYTSDFRQVAKTNLQGALERYNKKYADMANMDSKFIDARLGNQTEIKNTLEKVYADKTVQPYLQRMDLNTRKLFVDVISQMADNIQWSEIPKIAASLTMYQDTGNVPQYLLDVIKTGGSVVGDVLGGVVGGLAK